MALELDSLQKALASLESVLQRACDAEMMGHLDQVTQDAIKAGAIQNFEFSYELCWKFMKRWLEMNLGSVYVDGVSRQELFRLSAESRLIDDVTAWMNYHKARNQTAHTYNAGIAEEVFRVTTDFLPDAKRFLEALEAHND